MTIPSPVRPGSLLNYEVLVKQKIAEILGHRRQHRVNLDDIYSETLLILNQRRLTEEEAQTLRTWVLAVMLALTPPWGPPAPNKQVAFT